jgi:chemotaxis protein methyltransferase WspC
MTASPVESWLSAVIGLDVGTIGSRSLEDSVKRRMAVCSLLEERDYLDHVKASPDELSVLIEMIVVPETWFFRDREPFVFLAQFVATTWLAAHPGGVLKVLSLPCSSGEEPYSIAMSLQSAGLPSSRYRIDAVDINPALLRKAEKGDYGGNSFRSGVPTHSERYFKHHGAIRTVSAEVRSGIRFIQGNIMSLPGSIAGQAYDIIFCRNLLIYQHGAARSKIMATVEGLLDAEGLLFVGHAEMMSLLADRYEPIRHSGAFAYSRRKTGPSKVVPEAQAVCALVAPGPAPVLSLESRIDRVRALADQGRLDDAAAICQDVLKENPQLAEAHFLLGLIRTAAGHVQEAEECLSRTLYLDADNYEALVHLSLLKAQRGDEAAAERLRQRAGRIHDKAQVPA